MLVSKENNLYGSNVHVKGTDRQRKWNIRENIWKEDWTVIEGSQSMELSSVNISEMTLNNYNNNNNHKNNNLPRNFKLVHCRVQTSHSMFQSGVIPAYLFKINFNIILQSKCSSSKLSHSFGGFPTRIVPKFIFSYNCHILRHSPPS